MGDIIKMKCGTCGYEKAFHVGAGFQSCNIDLVKRCFSPKKIEEFVHKFESKEVKRFMVEQKVYYCDTCNDDECVQELHYELKSGEKKDIINGCPVCGNACKKVDLVTTCPKCGGELTSELDGYWD